MVAFGRHPHRRRFAGLAEADLAAIDHAMRLTGITDFAARAVGELSGGEMQRVWLASCLAQDTAIVLLDEPTNHLDLRYQIETLDLVRELAEVHGVAVGIVLHDLDHAARIADQVVLLHRGQVHAAGTAGEVLTSQHLSHVYEIPIDVSADPLDGRPAHRRAQPPLGPLPRLRLTRRRARPPASPAHPARFLRDPRRTPLQENPCPAAPAAPAVPAASSPRPPPCSP